MTVPFTADQFLGIFVDYNIAMWPLQIIAYGLGLLVVAALWWRWTSASWLVPAILALMWAVNGMGYHYMFFSQINPLAVLFAIFFMLQALMFVAAAGLGEGLRFESERGSRSIAGIVLITYALLIYPLLGIWMGHGLMKGPLFGVAPCPTTVFTIGILLLTRGRWTLVLSVVPILWSLVGLAAVLQFGIYEDFGLAIAGLLLIVALLMEALGRRPARGHVK